MSMVASASAFLGPTPVSWDTGMSASWARRRASDVLRLLRAEEIGRQRLIAPVDIDRRLGAVLGQPARNALGGLRRGRLALDHSDQLVFVLDQPVEEGAGGVAHIGRDGDDVVAQQGQVLPLLDRAG